MRDLYTVSLGGEKAWLATFGSRREGYIISQVFVPVAYRRAGMGTFLLEKAIADADREGVVLRLMVVPDDAQPGMDERQLREWYRRYGFREMVAGSSSMERMPR